MRIDVDDRFGLALGFFATVGQVVLVREALSLSGGNELTVGLSFFSWLLGVGVGALVAGLLPCPGAALLGGAFVGPFLTGVFVLVLRLHRAIWDIPVGGDPSLLGLLGLLVLGLGVGGLTVGFLFTVAARASSKDKSAPVSRLYITEAIGALLGGLVFTFLLAGRLSHVASLGLSGSLVAATAVISKPGPPWSRVVGWGVALVLLFASLLGPLAFLDRWAEIKAVSLMGIVGDFVDSKDSAYGRLTLSKSEDQYQLLADGRLVHAFPDPWERPVPIHLALVQHPAPKSVLIIGGGPSDRLDAALAHHPEHVVLTYLDDRAHVLCHPYWPKATTNALDDPRVDVIQDDGRRYVSRTRERFDVVIISARPPLSSRVNRYHTEEFMRAVKKVLRPGGSMSVFAPGGANLLAKEAARAAASELATVRAVFPNVVIVPGIQIAIHGAMKNGVVSDDAALLEKRYFERKVVAPSFSSRRFATLFDKGRIRRTMHQLGRHAEIVNRDSRPFIYLAGIQLWERSLDRGRSAGAPTLTGLLEKWAWIFIAVPLLLWAVWKGNRLIRSRRGASDAVFAIATTGAAGMAAEVVVLHVFQAASGRLYAGLALLIALFMTGLALGAFFGRRAFSSGRPVHGIASDLTVLIFLVVSGPVLCASLNTPSIVAAWSLVAGLVTGAAFPALLARAAQIHAKDERKSAAVIETADHFGAALGALITGVIWLPVFGITTTCLLFACLKAASLAGQLLRKQHTG